MSNKGIDFANNWVRENVNAIAYAPDGESHPETEGLVQQLVDDAAKAGITREEIEEDMGDLDDLINGALDEAADAEVERMASKE
jgi:hypothetical protein